MTAPRRVVVSDAAADQIRAAEAWWRVNRSKAPNAIREELERGAALIALQPDIGTRARAVALEGLLALESAGRATGLKEQVRR